MTATVRVESDGALARVVLNRPDRLNSFDLEMAESLLSNVQQVAETSQYRVVLITGAGSAFCSGADLRFLKDLQQAGDTQSFRRLVTVGKELYLTFRSMPQIVLTGINGVAAGGGCSLAIAADYRIASESATLVQAFVRVGMQPDWSAYCTLPRLVGYGMAFELMLTGRPVAAQEALDLGLVNEVVPDTALDDRLACFSHSIAAGPPQAQQAIKQGLQKAMRGDLSTEEALLDFEIETQMACFSSKDSQEGVAAFLAKRPPSFGSG